MTNKSIITSYIAIGTLFLGTAVFNPSYAQPSPEASVELSIEDANLTVVKQIYADFASGNIPGFVAAL